MTNLAFVSIVLGLFVVLSRGPFIFAPEATRQFFIKLFLASTTRLRIVGISIVAFGVLMIIASQGHDQTAALVFKYYGWFIAIAATFFHVIFTSFTKDIGRNIMKSFNILTLRIFGLLAVVVGAVLIYWGLAVF